MTRFLSSCSSVLTSLLHGDPKKATQKVKMDITRLHGQRLCPISLILHRFVKANCKARIQGVEIRPHLWGGGGVTKITLRRAMSTAW
jgi:hypothetical protein